MFKDKFMRSTLRFIFSIILPFIIFTSTYAQTGRIVGKVVDGQTGDALPGANVVVEGTVRGAATDMEGNYVIQAVPVGNYVVSASMMGYATQKIKDVKVNEEEATKINFVLNMQAIMGDEVVVEADAVTNSEAGLLRNRQKSDAVSDAISSEAISRAGSGDAAEAMKYVTGASVVDGKYVYVRGLGDRYTSTQLNGAEIPSADPYKRAGSIDLIPSNLVDNITTVKSFTPDKPGNFSGGTVDIKTKDFPNNLSLSFSSSASYNTKTTFNENTLGVTSMGDYIWFGMDDGSLSLPSNIGNDLLNIDIIAAGKDEELAQSIHQNTLAFNHSMAPRKRTAPINQSYSFSVGNHIGFWGLPFGYLASFTYHRSHKNYDNGTYARYALKALSDQATGLENIFDLNDHKSSDEVLWGATLKSSYKLNPNQILSFTGIYNQNGLSTGRILEGPFPYDLGVGDVYQVFTQQYEERSLRSFQLNGDHKVDFLFGSTVNWKTSYAKSTQNEPDLRYFTSYITDHGTYGVKTNIPQERYYRELEEDRYNADIHFSMPFSLWDANKSKLKFGGSYGYKNRNFKERRFTYKDESEIGVQLRRSKGDLYDTFRDDNLGVVGTRVAPNGKTYSKFGIYLLETPRRSSNYTGDQTITASYFMLDALFGSRFRFIGGARYETTEMTIENEDPEEPEGGITTYDLLPSTNFVYSLLDNMNLRFAYGRTIARPTFREISSFVSYDFKEGDKYQGNPNLERTLIDNFDLRWEWFSRPGEIYAVSAFYKNFHDPIELVIKNNNYWITWQNVDEAVAYGAEFEVRKRLDIISEALSNFLIGSNLSLIHSQVDIGEEELEIIRETNPEVESTRPFQGQSPYLLNLNLSYDNVNNGLSSSIYYNIFGERLAAIGKGGTPDIYEQPAAMLNFSLSKRMWSHLTLKFSAENLLDSKKKKMHEFKEKDFITNLYQRGRTFSLGIKYDL